ncbi:MAG: chromate transporter [Burkholderiaceae bacterium]|nr:chromate transporter [Burkholderiaceae bacterium]
MSSSAPDAPPVGPRSPADLFFTFNRLALQGFGGVLAVAQRELVERKRWLTREQFLELLSAGQVLPGPNVVNLSLMVGDRYFGLRGALAALTGMLLVPLIIVLLLASLYGRFETLAWLHGALRGMGAVSAGLVLATAIKLLPALRSGALGLMRGLGVAAAATAAVTVGHWPLVWVLAGIGSLAIVMAWRATRP